MLNLKDATGASDVATLVLVGQVPALGGSRTESVVSAPGVETININSIVAAGQVPNVITKLAADLSLTTVNLTGSGALTLTTDALTHSASINGSAATGSLTINAAATVLAGIGVNINGGTANDTITAGLGVAAGGIATNQLINGGGGGDIINLGATHTGANQIDSLIYKAGTDSLLDLVGTSGASGGAVPNTGTMDVVNNFISGKDTIDLTSFGLSNTQAVIADKGVAASLGAMVTLASTAGFFTDAATVQRGVAEVHIVTGAVTDTYLFVDVNHNNTFDAATDLVVKFAGIGAVASADILH